MLVMSACEQSLGLTLRQPRNQTDTVMTQQAQIKSQGKNHPFYLKVMNIQHYQYCLIYLLEYTVHITYLSILCFVQLVMHIIKTKYICVEANP